MQPTVSLGRRVLVALVLGAHAAAALVWGALMPHGFGLTHPRTWVNDVGVAVVTVGALVAIPLVVRGRLAIVAVAAGSVAGGWLGVAASTAWTFPLTAAAIAGPLVAAAAAPLTLLWVAAPAVRVRPRRTVAAGVLALLAGASVAAAHRAPPSSVRPRNRLSPSVPTAQSGGGNDAEPVHARIDDAGRFRFERAGLRVDVEPFVRLTSRSPDAGWTVFAPDAQRRAPPLSRISSRDDGDAWLGRYQDDGDHVLRLASRPDAFEMTAWSTLQTSVHAHLASFLTVHLRGHARPMIRFAACADAPIEVRVADYPTGRPLRFAYRTDDDRLRVVEADSGEKGPFTVLCEGPLTRHDPLVFTFDGVGDHRLTFEVDGWTAQGSTEPSPTAGWGVPQATFAFSRRRDDPTSPVFLHFSLASTGVGRGFDTVTHRRGIYDAQLIVR